MMGTCALFGLTFSSHALHSHLLFQVFIITKHNHKAFLEKMSREFSDIWKEAISQAAPIPPRAGKQPYGVAQGSADFMGPVEMCGSRLTDSSLNSCSGHSW